MERTRYDMTKSVNPDWENRRPSSRKPVPLEADTPEVEVTTVPKTEKGIVANALFVNIRSTPEAYNNANVIGKIQKGSVLELKKDMGDYYQIEYNGRPAYISKYFVEVQR